MLEIEQATVNIEAQARLAEIRAQLGLAAAPEPAAVEAPAAAAAPAEPAPTRPPSVRPPAAPIAADAQPVGVSTAARRGRRGGRPRGDIAVGQLGGAAAGHLRAASTRVDARRGPWRTRRRRGRRSRPRRRRRSAPSTPTTPAGSSDGSRSTSARRAPSSTTTVPADADARTRSTACGPAGGGRAACTTVPTPRDAGDRVEQHVRAGRPRRSPPARPTTPRSWPRPASTPCPPLPRAEPAPPASCLERVVDLDDLLDERRARRRGGDRR